MIALTAEQIIVLLSGVDPKSTVYVDGISSHTKVIRVDIIGKDAVLVTSGY